MNVRAIDAALRAAGTNERAVQEKRYLKSALVHYGCDAASLKQVVRAHVPAKVPRPELVRLVEALWDSNVYERRAAAALVLQRGAKVLTAADVPMIERMLRASKTWALVDAIAVHVVGPLVEREPSLGKVLDRWAKDEDFWIRRSALLALLVPLRRGDGDLARFGRYADAMLDEKEFFIRMAIGWVLRETSKKRPELVQAWLAPRMSRASGVTRREATKYLAP